MGIHEEYGKTVLRRATSQFAHWFVEEDRTFEYPPCGMRAKLDGIIGEDCVAEIEGLNEKQIRAGILDLVFHPRPKKLLVIVPANLHNRPVDVQQTSQRLLDDLIRATRPNAEGQAVVLKGTGRNPKQYLNDDCANVQQGLRRLGVG